MKQKLKKYLKIGIPLFGILFILNSCLQEDDLKLERTNIEDLDNVNRLSIVSSEDIPDIINFIKSKSNEEMTFRIQYGNNDLISTPDGADIQQLELSIENLDAITQITNEFNKSNYTFGLSDDINDEQFHFMNLVIREYRDTFYLMIIKYVPIQEWIDSPTSNLSNYTGDIIYYNYQGYFVGFTEMTNGANQRTLFGQAAIDALQTNTTTGNVANTYLTNPPPTTDCDYGNDNNDGASVGGVECEWSYDFSHYVTYECVGCPNDSSLGYTPVYEWNYNCTSGDPGNGSVGSIFSDPCDTGTDYGSGSSGGGGTSSNDPCYDEPACDFPTEMFDENCECVSAEVFENPNVPVVQPQLPCKNLRKLTVNNAETRVKLKQLITESTTNVSREKAFKIRKNPSTNLDTPTEIYSSSDQDCAEMNIRNITGDAFAAAHLHPKVASCNTFGMFSGGDILQLAKLSNQYNGSGSDNYNSFTFMLAYNGQAYAIRMDDQQTMAKLRDINDDVRKSNRFRKIFDEEYNKLERQPGGTANENQLMTKVLSIIGEYALNVSLFKAETDNSNFVTDWNKVTLDNNNNIQIDSCD